MSDPTIDPTDRPDVAPAVERILKPIQQFVRGWMMSDSTVARGKAIGLTSGNQFWIVGRAGVLGDGDADVAAAGLAFHAADAVRREWDALPAGLTPRGVAAAYAQCCCDWGTDTLGVFDPARMSRLDVLGRRIVDAAPAALGPVFAGWRAMPQPPDVAGRVALTGQVLREMRGAAHIIAVQASGITPLEAILASPAAPPRSGPEWAERMGFVGPFRNPDEVRAQRDAAEALTSRIMARYIGTLDPAELAEFAELIETTRNSIAM
jgi:hypothetical protein